MIRAVAWNYHAHTTGERVNGLQSYDGESIQFESGSGTG